MSFLAPWMLAALPLASIPIIIHLINQRRYQSTPWAAMMFLLTANKMNRGYARIRQWLILAFRTLVIGALIFAIGRPLVSGYLWGGLGSFLGRGASTALVMVDRSPSMQARLGTSPVTKLQRGTEQIVETLNTLGTQRVVLIESNQNQPIELESAQSILQLPELSPSDKTADWPSMFSSALEYLQANDVGQCDLWICSDLRRSDWNANDGRWASLREAFATMGRRVRFRLVALPSESTDNRTLRITDSSVSGKGADTTAEISLVVRDHSKSNSPDSEKLPVTIDVNGNRSTAEVILQNGIGKLVGHRIGLPQGQTRGYGSISIPADQNPFDNHSHFAIDARPTQRCVVVTSDPQVGRVLQLAAEIPSDDEVKNVSEVIPPNQVGSIAWDELALLIWHAPLPQKITNPESNNPESVGEILQAFVSRGGQVLFLPPEETNTSGMLFGCQWDNWSEPNPPAQIATWRGDTDVLANTQSGASLPVGKLSIKRYAKLNGDVTPLARLDGDIPLLARAVTGQGGVYFCATTVRATDSSLANDGVVLYVMLQRMLSQGANSLGNTRHVDAGRTPWKEAAGWKRVSGRDDALTVDNTFVAGVYRDQNTDGRSDRLIAINRSVPEDDATLINDTKLESLFEGLVFERIDPESSQSGSLVEEAWRAFLIITLIAMVGEAILCLPRDRETNASPKTSSTASLTGGSVA